MAAIKSLSFDLSIIKPLLGPGDSTWERNNQKHRTTKVVENAGRAKLIDTVFAEMKNVPSLHFA